MIKKRLGQFQNFFSENPHFFEVAKKGSSTFILKIIATGAGFFFNLVLAQIYGARISGEYFLSFTVIMVGLIFCKMGLDNALMRFVSEYLIKGKSNIINDLYIKSIKISIFISLLIILLFLFLADEIAVKFFNKEEISFYLKIMSIGLLPASLSFLHSGALKGLKKTIYAAIVDPFFISFFNLLLVYPLYLFIGLEGAAFIFVGSHFLTACVAFYLWRKAFHFQGERENFPLKKLLGTSLPLLFVASMELILRWTDTIVLGIWVSSAEVGIYNISLRIAFITGLVLVAINSITAPKFSELYHSNKINELENLARKTTLLMVLLAFPIFFLCMAMPEWLLSLFGSEFILGAGVIRILAIGQYFNVIMGSVGYLLMMTGYEKSMQYITLSVAGLNIILNVLLVPYWGMEGAAVATMINLILINILGSIFVFKKIGIIVFPFFQRRI